MFKSKAHKMVYERLLCVLVAMTAVASAGPLDKEAEMAVAESSQAFAGKVYTQLKSTPGNILVCPVSVQTILALVQAGAMADTSQEIQRALSLPEDKIKTQNGYKSLMQSLQKSDKVSMDIANRVYIKEGYKINQKFNEVAKNSFYAGIEPVNFNNPTTSAQKINQWVEEITHNKIKDLIDPGSIDGTTRMILVNALYFKGAWQKRFEDYNTRDEDFFLTEKEPVKVRMMSTTETFKHATNDELDCQFLELPYDGNQYAMTIVLPNKKDGLAALENKIEEVLKPQQYKTERVHVKLPQFKIETTIQFNDILKKMGMTKSFTDAADFSGLLETKELLSISEVIQKNFIKVTEEGTEAASATAGFAVATSLVIYNTPPKEFYADHPFIFILHNKVIGAKLFVGRIEKF